ncbi:MAG: 50S ribosomal protein L18 [Anaerolineae bacterium]
MTKTSARRLARDRRHERVRKRVSGTSARPRLSVYRSLAHIYAQVIDDSEGRTLVSASTLDASLKAQLAEMTKTQEAQAVGRLVAQRALDAGITQVVFDRGGYVYHGRVKAVADAAREAGLQF